MAPDPFDAVRRGARDVFSTGLGLGILGFQQLQIRRQDLQKSLGTAGPAGAHELGRLVHRLTPGR